VDPGPEERLVDVDVSQPGDDALIEQRIFHRADRAAQSSF
jgi:hypothetical protein